MLINASSLPIVVINAGPEFIVSLFACVARINKFSLISSENKLVTLVKIYLVKISNLLAVAFAIKQTTFIWSITFENTYWKAEFIISSYFLPLVSPYPWLSKIIIGLFS